LEEVELLVAARGPEVLPVIHEVVLLFLALVIGEGHAALLSKGRVRQHVVVALAVVSDQRVGR
jgi:hypothetical protein